MITFSTFVKLYAYQCVIYNTFYVIYHTVTRIFICIYVCVLIYTKKNEEKKIDSSIKIRLKDESKLHILRVVVVTHETNIHSRINQTVFHSMQQAASTLHIIKNNVYEI